jgi:hypothetical protein
MNRPLLGAILFSIEIWATIAVVSMVGVVIGLGIVALL